MSVAMIGCAIQTPWQQLVRTEYLAGDVNQALWLADTGKQKAAENEDCLDLDRAVLLLLDGRPREAELVFRQVRDRFDFLAQSSATEQVASTLTDDRAISYAGEDYEQVLIRFYLTLCSLMQDETDALAYAHQIESKQRSIIESGGGEPVDQNGGAPGHDIPDEFDPYPKLSYAPIAVGPYFLGLIREASHVQYDEAATAFSKVARWEPDFLPAKDDLERVRFGVHSKPGHGVVYVIALVGEGPYKISVEEEPTSAALFLADRIVSMAGQYSVPPTLAAIKVPCVVTTRSEVDTVFVSSQGLHMGATQTITNVNAIAKNQQFLLHDQIVARAVARRVLKKGMIYGIKDISNVNPYMSLALDVAGVVWEATESADVRCWSLLPGKIQIRRIELPVGEHDITVCPARDGQPAGLAHSTKVRVLDGANTYVLAAFPNRHLVGRVVTSAPADP